MKCDNQGTPRLDVQETNTDAEQSQIEYNVNIKTDSFKPSAAFRLAKQITTIMMEVVDEVEGQAIAGDYNRAIRTLAQLESQSNRMRDLAKTMKTDLERAKNEVELT